MSRAARPSPSSARGLGQDRRWPPGSSDSARAARAWPAGEILFEQDGLPRTSCPGWTGSELPRFPAGTRTGRLRFSSFRAQLPQFPINVWSQFLDTGARARARDARTRSGESRPRAPRPLAASSRVISRPARVSARALGWHKQRVLHPALSLLASSAPPHPHEPTTALDSSRSAPIIDLLRELRARSASR